MRQFEMGGYLPLELPTGSLPWDGLNQAYVLEVNTGRTAIWCALKSLRIRKLFVPSYYCPDVIEMLRHSGVELSFYGINRELLPQDVTDEPDAAIILVNYYGLLTGQIQTLVQKFSKVILDLAHAFYMPPILREGVMNIYSCRKFIGVSDGACLIGKDIVRPELEPDQSYGRATHLLKCYETGTNGAYQESKAAERDLGGFRTMAPLTRRILCGVDYDSIASARMQNAAFLHDRLSKYQRLRFSLEGAVPYLYPLLLERDIHGLLLSSHIYVPYLWRELLAEEWHGTIEQEYTQNIVALPIDQRYNEQDMALLANIISKILSE